MSTLLAASLASADQTMQWKQLPPLPSPLGFAGPFAGVSGGALLVAGGANFPDQMPWEGGRKVIYDSIFVLPKSGAEWVEGFKLPQPAAYGVSVTTPGGLICAGGANPREHRREVFRLVWKDRKVQVEPLPPLPRALANGCGALVGHTLYLAGGTERPDATNALKVFWALELSAPQPQWRELPPWSGPGRMLAVAGAHEHDFFLFGGVELEGDASGKPVRRYLKDAYRFEPSRGWTRIADLPRAAVAAPSPALKWNQQLLVVSGDDGSQVNFEPKSEHPGFPRDVLAYEPRLDRWTKLGDSALSCATAPVVEWEGQSVIVNGETRPGRRTRELWALPLPAHVPQR